MIKVVNVVLQVALRLYSGENSATLMTSDRGTSGGAELELNNTPVSKLYILFVKKHVVCVNRLLKSVVHY